MIINFNIIGIIKEFPLVSRWFISLAKSSPFMAAVWGASNDVGYSAYHAFLLQRGKSASLSTVVSSPPKGGQSTGQSTGQSASKVKSEARIRTEVQSAQIVCFTYPRAFSFSNLYAVSRGRGHRLPRMMSSLWLSWRKPGSGGTRASIKRLVH